MSIPNYYYFSMFYMYTVRYPILTVIIIYLRIAIDVFLRVNYPFFRTPFAYNE